jgi:hypothetical protein
MRSQSAIHQYFIHIYQIHSIIRLIMPLSLIYSIIVIPLRKPSTKKHELKDFPIIERNLRDCSTTGIRLSLH